MHELLDELELPGYVKTSGADGIHVLAPIQRRATFEDTYAFAEAAARLLEARHPGKVTTEWLKKKRERRARRPPPERLGQDDRVGLLGAPEAGRAGLDTAAWDELTAGVRPRDFTMEVVLDRIARAGDLFAPVLDEPRALGAAAKRLARLAR